jgi:hypothetical protein
MSGAEATAPKRRFAGWRRWAIGTALFVALLAVPILNNEWRCQVPASKLDRQFQPLMAPEDWRPQINSLLTYPEWSIVHAYDDLAGVMRASSESDYQYFGFIRHYWSSLCAITSRASAREAISFDYKAMLYIIGWSATIEMGLKGLYETTIGRATAWWRGPTKTPEDQFALKVAEHYASFLRQTPWYEYPFLSTLTSFWSETPFSTVSVLRSLERRVALSLEYTLKAPYAWAIGKLAGLDPAPTKIRSVVVGVTDDAVATEPRIKRIGAIGSDAILIETPRYREFNQIIATLAARGGDVVEIAGNHVIFVTVLAPDGKSVSLPGAEELFSVPVQARSGWRRIGFDVRVAALADILRTAKGAGIEIEHAYDY